MQKSDSGVSAKDAEIHMVHVVCWMSETQGYCTGLFMTLFTCFTINQLNDGGIKLDQELLRKEPY